MGTISTVPTGLKPADVVTVGRIKLTNPPEDQWCVVKTECFAQTGGNAAQPDQAR